MQTDAPPEGCTTGQKFEQYFSCLPCTREKEEAVAGKYLIAGAEGSFGASLIQ